VLRCLRDTGMPIAQMRRYPELARRGQATMAERLSLLTEHDRLLQAQHSHLQDKINWCRSQISTTQRRSRGKTGK
jgi:DNA-binding transcriptional MerR regulator